MQVQSLGGKVDGAEVWMNHDASASAAYMLPNVADADGAPRPSSSQDVTPTQTPVGSQPLAINTNFTLAEIPRSPEKPGVAKTATTRPSPKRVLLKSRFSSGREDAPRVLRHLRIPDDPRLAETAAEILQLG